MAGTIQGNITTTSVYWKNGTLMDTLQTPVGFVGTQPKCIAVVGNDVYVGGIAINSQGYITAMYWKNGKSVLLNAGLVDSYVSAIAVSGTNLYFTGYVTKANEQEPTPVYWKNDVVFYLPGSDTTSYYTKDIIVYGQDVYITSASNYWKNGDSMGTNANGSIATLAILGSDIYYAGTSGWPNPVATYWKNGKAVILDEPVGAESRPSAAFAMSVSGSNIYILGTGYVGSTNSYTNRYWVNGKRVELNNQGLPLNATDIASAGGDVYISGSRGAGINTIDYIGCYWKNGEPVDFPNDKTKVRPSCIFVSND